MFLFFGLFSVKGNHAIYISVIEMEEDRLSIKVFSDDLQDAIRNYSSEYVEAGVDDFVSKNRKEISNYFNDKCELKINKNLISLTLNDFKVEGDASFLYFTFNCESDWSSLSLKADYFMELFPDQSNVVTVINGNQKQYARLTKSNSTYKITFD